MNFKKLISIILGISFMLSSAIPLQVFAEDYCESHRNSKGGYIDYTCANSELLKVADNKANFVIVENLGPSGDSKYYCFNFKALDDVFEKNKLISVAELRKERNTLSKVNYPPFFNLYKTLAIGVFGFIGALSGYFFQKIPSYRTESQINEPSLTKNNKLPSASGTPTPTANKLQPGHGALPAFIGALISGLVLLVGLYVDYDAQKNNFETDRKNKLKELNNKIVEINRSNEHKSNMLNLLLKSLEDSRIMSNIDMFCFYDRLDDTHCTPFDYDAKYVGINYTKAESASFPEKFKEIAAKIRKNLKKNGKLDPDNEISGKVVNPEQRELSD